MVVCSFIVDYDDGYWENGGMSDKKFAGLGEAECKHPIGEWTSVSVDKAVLKCVCCGKELFESVAAPQNKLVDLRNFGRWRTVK